MNMLKHLFNLTCWYIIIPAFVLLFSYLFDFKYLDVVQSAPFAVFYFIYLLSVTCVYGSSTDEPDEPMSFIS